MNYQSFFFEDDGYYPNHSYLPALFYPKCFNESSSTIQKKMIDYNWGNQWTGGVFDYHHYHAKTHEVLAVIAGAATITIGGPHGRKLDIEKGDALILPAGVAHKNEGATEDFEVLGAYPFGEPFDLKTGEKREYEIALTQIPDALMPKADPIYGAPGPLIELWNY